MPLEEAESFYEKLIALRKEDPILYERIESSFTIICKYTLLWKASNNNAGLDYINSVVQLKLLSLDELDQLFENYNQLKHKIYQQKFDLSSNVAIQKALNENYSKDGDGNFQTLANFLENSQADILDELKHKELIMKEALAEKSKGWFTYLIHHGKKLAYSAYKTSFLEMGGSLVQSLMMPWSKSLQDKSLVQKTQVAIKYLLGRSVLAARKPDINDLTYSIGVGAGVWLSWNSSGYSLFRQFFIGTVSQQAYQFFQHSIIDDQSAVISSNLQQFTPIRCAIALQLLLAFAEFAYSGYYQSLFLATASLGMAAGAQKFAERYVISRLNSTEQQAEYSKLIKLLFYVSGSSLGHGLMTMLMPVLDAVLEKQAARNAFVAYLERLQQTGTIADCQTQMPSLLNLQNWWTGKNPVEVEWRFPRDNFFSKMQCDLVWEPYPNSLLFYKATCESAGLSPPAIITL